MTDLKFEVQRVRKGTDKQKAAGIHGTFTLAVLDGSTTIFTLHDYKLCQTKAGEWYIQSPYRTYEGKDDSGSTVTKKLQYYKLFPNREDWDKQKPIIELVRREVEKADPPRSSSPTVSVSTPDSGDEFDF